MELMKNISIGIDIATSLSVIGAAIAFITNQRKDYLKKFNLQKIKEIEKIIHTLEKEEEKWFNLSEKIKWARTFGDEVPTKEIVDVVLYSEFKVKQILNGTGDVWLDEDEKQKLSTLKSLLENFSREFSKALEGKEANIISTDDVLTTITNTIRDLSEKVKEKVEQL
jgi:hypothetical protein